MNRHGKRAVPNVVLPSAKLPCLESSTTVREASDIPESLLRALPEAARQLAREEGLTLIDCQGITVSELQEVLHVSKADAESFLLRARKQSASALEQVAIDSQKAKPRSTTAPPVPLKKAWLQLSVKAGAVPLQLLAVQPARAKTSDERRTNLLSTVFSVAVTLGKSSLRYSAAIDCSEPPQAVRE